MTCFPRIVVDLQMIRNSCFPRLPSNQRSCKIRTNQVRNRQSFLESYMIAFVISDALPISPDPYLPLLGAAYSGPCAPEI